MDFAELVLRQLDARGENVNSFEAKMGWKQGFLRAFVRSDAKRSHPTLDKACTILSALGLELQIGPVPEAPPPAVAEIDGEVFAAVLRYDAQLSAGPGAENRDGEPGVGAVAFRRDWLQRERISPGDAMVLSVRGDSMAPTLCNGDLVMVDRRKTVPVGRRIYALVGPDGEARVKRLEKLPEALLLRSDNEDFPTELIPAQDANRIRILGEVVWWGHTVRE